VDLQYSTRLASRDINVTPSIAENNDVDSEATSRARRDRGHILA
jgi:hypothetical protein